MDEKPKYIVERSQDGAVWEVTRINLNGQGWLITRYKSEMVARQAAQCLNQLVDSEL